METEMTKTERSLLLYLETRAVDHRGFVRVEQMNEEDMAIAKRWNTEGFIEFKRVTKRGGNGLELTYAVRLTDAAWELVHKERRARAERNSCWES